MQLRHPVAGSLDFDYESLTLLAPPEHSVLTYLPRPGSATADALQLLLSWVDERAAGSVPS